jgi:hypothetical protein
MLALSLFAISMSGCKESNVEPEPADLAAKIAGTYTFSEMEWKDRTISASESNLKGTIVITKKGDALIEAKFDLRLKADDIEFMVYEIPNIRVSESSGMIELYYETDRIGQVTGKKLKISAIDEVDEHFFLSLTR